MSMRFTTEERFWEKVDKKGDNECWPWLGKPNHDGYPLFRWEHGTLGHRYSFWLHKGAFPLEARILHHCDNRWCTNPKCLWKGTQQDNIQDMVNKRRQKGTYRPGELCPTAKLTEQNVKDIREAYLVEGIPQNYLAEIYGVGCAQICRIIKGTRWAHIL